MTKYIYCPDVGPKSFSEYMDELRRRGYKVEHSSINAVLPRVVQNILNSAPDYGINFIKYDIDFNDYEKYFHDAGYTTKYSDYYRGNQKEKSVEHYVALKLLNLSKEDIFIDIASERSPVYEIYSRLTGATTFSQDIMYPEGINDNQIGGDACVLPVSDGFASKAALTCSFEHFEGDADARLFLELSRVLKTCGVVCIIPFYVSEIPATQTNPAVSVPANVPFDNDTIIFCTERWKNRHARF